MTIVTIATAERRKKMLRMAGWCLEPVQGLRPAIFVFVLPVGVAVALAVVVVVVEADFAVAVVVVG